MVHAADDAIVRASYHKTPDGLPMHYGSRDLYEALHASARNLHYDEFPAGFMRARYQVNPHCSWVVVSSNEGQAVREWLFAQ